MQKVLLVGFNGDMTCFVHVLLNALDLTAKGAEARIVFEGAACGLIPNLAKPENPLHRWYQEAKDKGLIAGACRACSAKMKTTEAAVAEGFALLDDMSGHPSLGRYMAEGYTILTF